MNMNLALHIFWPTKWADLFDNQVTFGVIESSLEIGVLILGLGFWIKGD